MLVIDKRVSVKNAPTHSNLFQTPFYLNLLSTDRPSNSPFSRLASTHFPKKLFDTKFKYEFEDSTPSRSTWPQRHFDPLQPTLTQIWMRWMISTPKQVLKSLSVISKLSRLRIMSYCFFNKFSLSPFWDIFLHIKGVLEVLKGFKIYCSRVLLKQILWNFSGLLHICSTT